MAKTLYVGNLNFRTEEEGLRAAFSEYGAVTDARIVIDRDTGRSRGFGFVEMEDDAAAETAIESMNGAELDGRPLRVRGRHLRVRARHLRVDGRSPACRWTSPARPWTSGAV